MASATGVRRRDRDEAAEQLHLSDDEDDGTRTPPPTPEGMRSSNYNGETRVHVSNEPLTVMKEAERLFEGGFKTLGENATLNPHGKSVLKTIISLMRPAEERAEFDGEEDRHAAKRNEGFVVKDHAGVVTESFDAPTVNVKDMRSTFETTYRWMRTLNNYNKLGDTNYSEKVEALANILKREIINKDKLWRDMDKHFNPDKYAKQSSKKQKVDQENDLSVLIKECLDERIEATPDCPKCEITRNGKPPDVTSQAVCELYTGEGGNGRDANACKKTACCRRDHAITVNDMIAVLQEWCRPRGIGDVLSEAQLKEGAIDYMHRHKNAYRLGMTAAQRWQQKGQGSKQKEVDFQVVLYAFSQDEQKKIAENGGSVPTGFKAKAIKNGTNHMKFRDVYMGWRLKRVDVCVAGSFSTGVVSSSSGVSAAAPPSMRTRIADLDAKLLHEDPPRRTRNVDAKGACFFLAGNLVRQEISQADKTESDASLEDAGRLDRAAVVAYMRDHLEMPMSATDLETLRIKIESLTNEDFPGANGTADAYFFYMSNDDGWADTLVVSCWQACFGIRFRIVSNLDGDAAQVDLPGWVTDADTYPVALIGHLADHDNGRRVGVHFVFPQLISVGGNASADASSVLSSGVPTKANADAEAAFLATRKQFKPRGFETIYGQDRVVAQAAQVVDGLQNNALVPDARLLVGPPGVGKTSLMQALASQCGATLFNMKGDFFLSGSKVEQVHRVQALFKVARAHAPSVVLIDECQKCFNKPKRGEAENWRVHTFIEESNEEEYQNERGKPSVLIMGATNDPNAISEPILDRFGDWDACWDFDPLNGIAHRKLLEDYIAFDKKTVSFDESAWQSIVTYTQRKEMSGRALKDWWKFQVSAVHDASGGPRGEDGRCTDPLSFADFEKAFRR